MKRARGQRGRVDGQEGGRWAKGESGGPEEGGWWQVSVGGGSLRAWALGEISQQHVPCFDWEACSTLRASACHCGAVASAMEMLVVVLDTGLHVGPGQGCVTWGHGCGCQHTMQEVGEEKGASVNMNIHAMTQCHGLK